MSATDIFFHQGDSASAFYILPEGKVKITHITPDGHQVIVRLAGPGDSFGVTATLSKSDYEISAQARTGSVVLGWTARAVEQLTRQYPAIVANALCLVEAHYENLLEQYHDMVTQRVARRAARALLRLGDQLGYRVKDGILIDVPLSRQDLAEMTGTDLYNVSRILSGWEREGLVIAGEG